MMDKKDILSYRKFLAEIASESDLLPKELFNEIMFSYSDKKIIAITERMIDKSDNQINEGIGMLIVGITAWIAYAKRKAQNARDDMIESQAKSCDHLIGDEKKRCLDDLRKNSNEKQIATMKKYMKKCDKIRDPEKCKYEMKKEIYRMKRKIKL